MFNNKTVLFLMLLCSLIYSANDNITMVSHLDEDYYQFWNDQDWIVTMAGSPYYFNAYTGHEKILLMTDLLRLESLKPVGSNELGIVSPNIKTKLDYSQEQFDCAIENRKQYFNTYYDVVTYNSLQCYDAQDISLGGYIIEIDGSSLRLYNEKTMGLLSNIFSNKSEFDSCITVYYSQYFLDTLTDCDTSQVGSEIQINDLSSIKLGKPLTLIPLVGDNLEYGACMFNKLFDEGTRITEIKKSLTYRDNNLPLWQNITSCSFNSLESSVIVYNELYSETYVLINELDNKGADYSGYRDYVVSEDYDELKNDYYAIHFGTLESINSDQYVLLNPTKKDTVSNYIEGGDMSSRLSDWTTSKPTQHFENFAYYPIVFNNLNDPETGLIIYVSGLRSKAELVNLEMDNVFNQTLLNYNTNMDRVDGQYNELEKHDYHLIEQPRLDFSTPGKYNLSSVNIVTNYSYEMNRISNVIDTLELTKENALKRNILKPEDYLAKSTIELNRSVSELNEIESKLNMLEFNGEQDLSQIQDNARLKITECKSQSSGLFVTNSSRVTFAATYCDKADDLFNSIKEKDSLGKKYSTYYMAYLKALESIDVYDNLLSEDISGSYALSNNLNEFKNSVNVYGELGYDTIGYNSLIDEIESCIKNYGELSCQEEFLSRLEFNNEQVNSLIAQEYNLSMSCCDLNIQIKPIYIYLSNTNQKTYGDLAGYCDGNAFQSSLIQNPSDYLNIKTKFRDLFSILNNPELMLEQILVDNLMVTGSTVSNVMLGETSNLSIIVQTSNPTLLSSSEKLTIISDVGYSFDVDQVKSKHNDVSMIFSADGIMTLNLNRVLPNEVYIIKVEDYDLMTSIVSEEDVIITSDYSLITINKNVEFYVHDDIEMLFAEFEMPNNVYKCSAKLNGVYVDCNLLRVADQNYAEVTLGNVKAMSTKKQSLVLDYEIENPYSTTIENYESVTTTTSAMISYDLVISNVLVDLTDIEIMLTDNIEQDSVQGFGMSDTTGNPIEVSSSLTDQGLSYSFNTDLRVNNSKTYHVSYTVLDSESNAWDLYNEINGLIHTYGTEKQINDLNKGYADLLVGDYDSARETFIRLKANLESQLYNENSSKSSYDRELRSVINGITELENVTLTLESAGYNVKELRDNLGDVNKAMNQAETNYQLKKYSKAYEKLLTVKGYLDVELTELLSSKYFQLEDMKNELTITWVGLDIVNGTIDTELMTLSSMLRNVKTKLNSNDGIVELINIENRLINLEGLINSEHLFSGQGATERIDNYKDELVLYRLMYTEYKQYYDVLNNYKNVDGRTLFTFPYSSSAIDKAIGKHSVNLDKYGELSLDEQIKELPDFERDSVVFNSIMGEVNDSINGLKNNSMTSLTLASKRLSLLEELNNVELQPRVKSLNSEISKATALYSTKDYANAYLISERVLDETMALMAVTDEGHSGIDTNILIMGGATLVFVLIVVWVYVSTKGKPPKPLAGSRKLNRG